MDTDSKVHGANMGPTWGLSTPDGPHVGPMNLAIREIHKISCDSLKDVVLNVIECLLILVCIGNKPLGIVFWNNNYSNQAGT